MDAFESIVSMLLRHEGYWTTPSFKVKLTADDKRRIGRHSSPRWELDVLAYHAASNEVLVVECKSFLDSTGVVFRNDTFEVAKRYKLFTEPTLREIVLSRLSDQLLGTGSCRPAPTVTLCLAAGKIARKSDLTGLRSHFAERKWRLIEPEWIRERLCHASEQGYENDIAFVVSKLLNRKPAAC